MGELATTVGITMPRCVFWRNDCRLPELSGVVVFEGRTIPLESTKWPPSGGWFVEIVRAGGVFLGERGGGGKR